MPRPPRFLTALAALPVLALPSNLALSPDGKLFVWEQVQSDFEKNSRPCRIFFGDSRNPLSIETLKRRVFGTSKRPAVRPLTRDEEDAVDPSFSPDGRWIAFRSARGPGAAMQVWGLSLEGGEGIALTAANSNVLDYAWTSGGGLLFLAQEPRAIWRDRSVLPDAPAPPDSVDVMPTMLFEGDETMESFALSHDETRVVFTMRAAPEAEANPVGDAPDHVELHVVDLATRQPRRLTHQVGNESSPTWSFDDGEIFFLAQDSSLAGPRIQRVPAHGGESSVVTRRLAYPVIEFRTCRDSDRLFATARDGENDRLVRIRPREGSHEILIARDGRIHDLAVHSNGEKLLFVVEGLDAAPEIASWTFPDKDLVQLTFLNHEAPAP